MKDFGLGALLAVIILFELYAAILALTTFKMYKTAVALVFIAAALGFLMLLTALTSGGR
jgi:hypothetical protein